MRCPICNVILLMSDRQGIEIDYCPKCRGIWLDRGELEKIIDRSMNTGNKQDQSQDYNRQNSRGNRESGNNEPDGKRGSMLGNLFSDIFG
jgi:Zn-finger nucleic acid-binding protein